jgi:hypothetical protein
MLKKFNRNIHSIFIICFITTINFLENLKKGNEANILGTYH